MNFSKMVFRLLYINMHEESGHSSQLHVVYKRTSTDHGEPVPVVRGQSTHHNVIGDLPVWKPGFLPGVQFACLAFHYHLIRHLPSVQCHQDVLGASG